MDFVEDEDSEQWTQPGEVTWEEAEAWPDQGAVPTSTCMAPCEGDEGESRKMHELELASDEPPGSRFFNKNAPHEPAPTVLEPDHPLMSRFQASLKRHLIRQLERLEAETSELDADLKKKEKEREATGVAIYGAQQEVHRQLKTLEEYQDSLEALMKEREGMEGVLKIKKLTWKENVDKLNADKKKENDLLMEQSKLAALERQLRNWEADMDSDLAINQRISDKTEIDRKQLIENKRKMDMHMLTLMTEVTRFEHELSVTKAEIEVKQEEKEIVNQSVADATADLQALAAEERRLFAAWNSVIVTMGHRDSIHGKVVSDLRDCQEAFHSLTAEIESYKRSFMEETRKNERMGIVLGRVEGDLNNAMETYRTLVEKHGVMEQQLSTVFTMTTHTEKELQLSKIETSSREAQYAVVRNELEKQSREKRNIEDEVLLLLQEQMTNDKAAIHINRLVKESREKTRQAELTMVDLENKIAKKFLQVEEYKSVLVRNCEILGEMSKEIGEKERMIKDQEGAIKRILLAISSRQNDMVVIMKKISQQMERSGSKHAGQSPLELKVQEVEKTNADLQEKNERLQSLWLIQQNNNVKLTRQRDEQLKEIQILRKQVVIMVQRTLKTELELEKEEDMSSEVNRSIRNLQHRLEVLNATLTGRKDYKDQLDKNNAFTQNMFLQTLKESEMEQVKLKADIQDLEVQLEELTEAMLSAQREMLAWEKKIKLAIETKISIHRERQPSGELGQMKMEIHRMEVRYSQLKKAQDKLTADLENCVLRRDAILDGADAKEKRAVRGFNNRFTFQKKLEDMRNKIKQLQAEQRNVEKIIKATEEGHQDLLNQMNEKTEQLKKLQDTTKDMDRQLEDGYLHKQQNLEKLVRRQKKCKLYTTVKTGRYRLMHRNELALDTEMAVARTTNDSLISITESLMQDFPSHRFVFSKIHNLVKAKPS